MSGRLVMLDRHGQDLKTYTLKEGFATLGSDPVCDIRIYLPTVCPHHATVSVHTNQSVVHAVGTEPTLVNGAAVSVSALRHGDHIVLGGRRLRWEYNLPAQRRTRHAPPMPAGARRAARAGRGGGPARARRVTTGGGRPALALPLRASMPARAWRSGDASTSSSSGKQVAIVQPWGTDTSELNEPIMKPAVKPGKRSRASRQDDSDAAEDEDQPKRRWSSSAGAAEGGDSATKASLWCESRRAPRRTPLKIHDPPRVDHTKQAAIMLMTGHAPAERSPRQPALLLRRSPALRRPRTSQPTPRRAHMRSEGPHSISLLEIGSGSRRSEGMQRFDLKSLHVSPLLGSPKKSSLKDPSARKSMRKIESIKFDLSNLDGGQERSSEVILYDDSQSPSGPEADDSAAEDKLTLYYSESSTAPSPSSPRKDSRSSKMLEKSLRSSGAHTTLQKTLGQNSSEQSTLEETTLGQTSSQRSKLEQTTLTSSEQTPTLGRSPRPKKSLRGSIILKKALENSRAAYKASRSTKNLSGLSDATASSPRQNVETYSVVDLVSLDSDSAHSVYGSTASFDSPTIARRTRSGKPSLLASSTPYHRPGKGTPKSGVSTIGRSARRKTAVSDDSSISGSKRNLSTSVISIRSSERRDNRRSNVSNVRGMSHQSKKSTRRSASLTTPENTYWSVSLNTTKATRASKSRSRINDSDALLLDDDDDDASPRSSRRRSDLPTPRKNISVAAESPVTPSTDGYVTPENERVPDDAGTPVLNIQNLLDRSLDRCPRSGSRNSKRIGKRKTVAVVRSVDRPSIGVRAKSFTQASRRSGERTDASQDEDGIVTPTSAVELVPEAVKNKHSTAKKPQSKRSLIDTLDESDVVKQLFSSPVKRNLSRSMSDFSRWRDDDAGPATRHMVAQSGRALFSSRLSGLDESAQIEPDVFVSPLNTPNPSPTYLSGIKRLFARGPKNDLRDMRGLKNLLRTPRARRSIKNDLTNVSGVKKTFARSPKNRLSDVRVKELFSSSPKNDLRRVSGVKALFQYNEIREVASPDVRGIDRLYGEEEQLGTSDVSGVEELLQELEPESLDTTFDRLLGRPRLKAYGKSRSMTTIGRQRQKRAAKSLHKSIDAIETNVEEWLLGQLQKSLSKKSVAGTASRELQNLSTATVGGAVPVLVARARSSAAARDQSMLPIKKRSLAVASLGQSGRVEASLGRSDRTEASLGRSGRTDASLGRSGRMEVSLGRSGRIGASLGRSGIAEVSLGRSARTEVSLGRSARAEVSSGRSGRVEVSSGRSGKAEVFLGRSCRAEASLVRSGRAEASLGRSGRAEASLGRSDRVDVSLGRSGRAESSLGLSGRAEASLGQSDRPESASSRSGRMDVSLGRNTVAEGSAGRRRRVEAPLAAVPASLLLPIKKRVVVHSTPLKGVDATLNTTALARMSPIAALKPPPKTSLTTLKDSPKIIGKSKRSIKTKSQEMIVPLKLSPKEEVKSKPLTPIQPRTTRRRKAAVGRLSTVIKRRKSITISKKPPVLGPKSAQQAAPEKPEPPERARNTRSNQVQEKASTPTETRATARRATVVTGKLKPNAAAQKATEIVRPTRKAKVIEEEKKQETLRPARKTKAAENTIKKSEVPQGTTRTRRNQKIDDIEVEIKPVKRGRKTQEERVVENDVTQNVPKRGRQIVARGKTNEINKNKSVPNRGRRAQMISNNSKIDIENTPEQKPRRGRKTQPIISKESELVEEEIPKRGRRTRTQTKSEVTETAPTRSRAAKASLANEPKKPARGRKKVESPKQSSEKQLTRGKSKKVTIAEEVKIGGRRVSVKVEVLQATNTSVNLAESPARATRRRVAKDKPKTRGRRKAESPKQFSEKKPTRGKSKKVTIAEEVEIGGRRTNVKVVQATNTSVKREGKWSPAESPADGKGATRRRVAKDEPTTSRGNKAAGADATTSRKRKSNEPVAKAAQTAAKRRKVPAVTAEEQRSTRSRRR